MADPQHVPILDGLDRFTVRLYRSGVFSVAFALGLMGYGAAIESPDLVIWGRRLLWVASLLCFANLHLYDKRFRWFIPLWGWFGLLVEAAFSSGGAATGYGYFGVGLLSVGFSAVALKEQFCFRIPGLRLVPLFLAAGVFALFFELPVAVTINYGIASALFFSLAVAKARQPLHFDVGNKAAYTI